jgi:hypothetical protein
MLRILLLLAGLLFASPSIASGTDPYEMSESDVQLVQTRLYMLNYDISEIDGKVGPETRKAIAEYQERISHPSTGVITEEEFTRLEKLDATGGTWAALSSSTDGAYSSVWSQSSRSKAERKAETGCLEKSDTPEKCTTIAAVTFHSSDQGWIAAVRCSRSDNDSELSYISLAQGDSKARAVGNAFEPVAGKGYSRDDCRLLTAIETRGRHK